MQRFFKLPTDKEVKAILDAQYEKDDKQFGAATVDKDFLPLGWRTITAPIVVHKVNMVYQINPSTYAVDVTRSEAKLRDTPLIKGDKESRYEHEFRHEEARLSRTTQRELTIFTLTKDSNNRWIVTPTEVSKALPTNRDIMVLRKMDGCLALISRDPKSKEKELAAEFYKPTPSGFNLIAKQMIHGSRSFADLDIIPIPNMLNQFLLWTAVFVERYRSGLMTLKVCEATSTGINELQTLIKDEEIGVAMDTDHPFKYAMPDIREDGIIECQDRHFSFSSGQWIDTTPEVPAEQTELSCGL